THHADERVEDRLGRLAMAVHMRKVHFVRHKARFCSLVATLCGATPLKHAADGRAARAAMREHPLPPYMIVQMMLREPSTAVLAIDWMRVGGTYAVLAGTLLARWA